MEDWYVYAWSAKWFESPEIIFQGINRDKTDKRIITALYKLIAQADVLIAHNGDKFDIKRIKTRFAFHGLPPLPNKVSVDTLKVLRKEFNLSSNSLDYACRFFGLNRKKPSDQKDWLLKMKAGDKKVWRKIKEYNIQDVVILEHLYKKIRPWVQNHPNMAVLSDLPDGCPNCASRNLVKQGFKRTKAGKYQQYQCKDCAAWSTANKVIKTK